MQITNCACCLNFLEQTESNKSSEWYIEFWFESEAPGEGSFKPTEMPASSRRLIWWRKIKIKKIKSLLLVLERWTETGLVICSRPGFFHIWISLLENAELVHLFSFNFFSAGTLVGLLESQSGTFPKHLHRKYSSLSYEIAKVMLTNTASQDLCYYGGHLSAERVHASAFPHPILY